MHSHLDIEIQATPGGEYKPLVLPDDFSLSVEEQNPVFNDVSFFSYPASVSTRQNMAVLKNIGHRDSALRGMDFEHARARIIADGLPLNTGQVITQEGAELSEEFQFNIDAQHESFSDLIGDLECRDVRVKDHIVIGEKIGPITFEGNISLQDIRKIYDGFGDRDWELTILPEYQPAEKVLNNLQKTAEFVIDPPQALGFSIPGHCPGFPEAQQKDGKPVVTENYINVSQPYPFPYCNARVAYAHPDVKTNDDGTQETDGTVKGNASNENDNRDYGQYWCLDANRQQSGICFYVLYFLDCLFEQLGVTFNKDELLEEEDIRRLCFFTTVCRYDEEDTGQVLTNNEIQQWLDSRNCGSNLEFRINVGVTKDGHSDEIHAMPKLNPNMDVDHMEYKKLSDYYTIPLGEDFSKDEMYDYWDFYRYLDYSPGGALIHVQYHRRLQGNFTVKAGVSRMIANSENFPKESVKSVISALENSFGVRFLYDPEKHMVTARLMRNVFKGRVTRRFNGTVLSMTPVNEKITGIRMAYSAESDKKEQRDNVRYGIKDYDTEFDYIEFPQDRTITNLTYNDIIRQVNSTNRNIYVDRQTGNVYRIKIDGDATDRLSLRPVLFQVGEYKGVEIGDCSEKNSDFVREYISDFRPLTRSIINALDYTNDRDGTVSPVYAPLLDVEMEHEFLPQYIESGTDVDSDELKGSCAFPNHAQLAMREELKLEESYDPTQTDDGNSPLQEIEWGLTVCVMRGGGSDSEIIEYDRGYDGFDNSKWRDTIGKYEMYSDSFDVKGAEFDYNADDPGIGNGERFSLSIRSYVQPEWADGPLCRDDVRDSSGNVVLRIRSRGLCDAFMRGLFRFLLHRKKYNITSLVTITQLLDIRNHWDDWYIIDGKVGFINKLSYEINRANGVGKVTIEFFSF
jgi:hypothetical protein